MTIETGFISLAILIAGGLGSVLRYLLAHFAGKLPWGILIANTAGSIVIGFAFTLTQKYSTVGIFGAVVASILAIGFAGGLTTFSSWAAQTAGLAKSSKLKLAATNLLLNLGCTSIAVLLGIFAANTLIK